jgi:hypothetical protein
MCCSSRCGLVSAVVTQLSSSAGGSSPGPGVTMVSAACTGVPQVGVEQQSNPFTLAVTGGTGTYQDARGEVTVKLLPGSAQANPAALTVYLDS